MSSNADLNKFGQTQKKKEVVYLICIKFLLIIYNII